MKLFQSPLCYTEKECDFTSIKRNIYSFKPRDILIYKIVIIIELKVYVHKTS